MKSFGYLLQLFNYFLGFFAFLVVLVFRAASKPANDSSKATEAGGKATEAGGKASATDCKAIGLDKTSAIGVSRTIHSILFNMRTNDDLLRQGNLLIFIAFHRDHFLEV